MDLSADDERNLNPSLEKVTPLTVWLKAFFLWCPKS